MSYCPTAMVAANSAVSPPTTATVVWAAGTAVNSGAERATKYTPAVTMVAAWISAETGVGPAMASGSQTYKGSWADFPATPNNIARVISMIIQGGAVSALGSTASKLSEPKAQKIMNMASSMPR